MNVYVRSDCVNRKISGCGGSAWLDTAIGVFSILWLVRRNARTFWIDQSTGRTAADRADYSAQRAAYEYTDRTCNCSTDGRTRSDTCHQTAPNQN